ncbi:GTP 3',8-cyclase MoaA [Clostridium senegalense]|uniref:GTP 3',8-cyclase MoaA n=1 Tax=Clostridium senegalense TaxID=1465809 RepID=UPI001C0F9D93|nr:GTP 3',8-cyclase MoaA [Clostridium senegalense]MBU5226858.1 GTP 3',8-cyclase MoaA [Clostridium senegalense]
MIDSFGRNINYLRISVTDLCNLRCKYCIPEQGINKIDNKEILTLEEIEEITKIFVELGVTKVRITGGEPLVRKNVLKLIKNIGSIEKIKDFSITTNGTLLEDYIEELKAFGVNRLNISLDTFNEDRYKYITRGGELQKVLNGIEKAKQMGISPIKFNVVLVKGFNDDEIKDFVNLTIDEDVHVRFIELMPIGQCKNWSLGKFISNETILSKVKGLEEVESEDISSPAKYYKLPNAKGKVGLISSISCNFCKDCNRIRLTCDGKLKLCLHSDEEIDLKNPLRNGEDVKQIIINAINKKPQRHNLEDGEYINRNMVAIGG